MIGQVVKVENLIGQFNLYEPIIQSSHWYL